MYVVKVMKLDDRAFLPVHYIAGDAGLDIFSVEEKIIAPHEYAMIHTGIAIELPQSTEAQIRPRSGLAQKYGVTVLNSPGTIDEGYRGEIGVLLINHGNQAFVVKKGMRIAQMVVKPTHETVIREVIVLSSSERGEAGFGSSGMGGKSE